MNIFDSQEKTAEQKNNAYVALGLAQAIKYMAQD